jgi:hypothetical protein
MACGDDLKTLLSRHVDGELSPEERARVEEHVAACAPCRELLQLFQKNESLLSNALSTESFGNTVIEAVISEIKREDQPLEAKPVEEGATEWFRARPVLQLAAAGLLVVGLVAVLSASHSRDLASLKAEIRNLSTQQQSHVEQVSRQSEEYEKLFLGMRSADAMRSAPNGGMLAYVATPQHLVVRASFDLKLYGAFAIYRRVEGETNDKFTKMNSDRRLDSPEFIDTSVKPGSAYVYKFRAYRSIKDDDFVESLPVTMRVPRVQEFSPEKGIRVQCIEIGFSHKVAKFLLHRTIGGRTLTEEFVIKPGERLGEVRDLPGFGNVDFRTNLTLDLLEDGNQTLAVRYTKAVLDSNGKELIERFKDGTVEVKTEEQDGVLSIRPNMRARFRTPGAATADVDIWKGSWIQVRTQD